MVYSIWKKAVGHINTTLQNEPYTLLFFAVLAVAFLIRVVNLNYNTAFNDEAIYIVVGRMGLYTSDWFTYGANQWIAGLPYIYPTLSALVYETTGLLGARFLNVIFSIVLIEEVYRFTRMLRLFDEETNHLAALVAAFLVTFSSVVIFVSRLATLDMLSFLLLMIGINSFIKAGWYANGKYYFISFLCLFFSFLTKIIVGVFFPILFILSLIVMRRRSQDHRKAAMTYLYAPFLIGSLFFAYTHLSSLITYIMTHKDQGKSQDFTEMLRLIWVATGPLILSAIPASLLLWVKQKKRAIVVLLGLAVIVPIFHISLNRLATFEKHLALTVIFLAPLVGYGTGVFVKSIVPRLSAAKPLRLVPGHMGAIGIRLALLVAIVTIGFLYTITSRLLLNELEQGWKDTTALQEYLKENVKPEDKILTQEGAVVILALYDKIFPPNNIVTFDWIDYAGFTDERGYRQALRDRYFDFVELDREYMDSNPVVQSIFPILAENYTRTASIGSFDVYEKDNN